VQSLDYETRGIWFEILCLMHESDERGVLLLNGKPMPEDALCRLLGLDKQILTTALTKIVAYGVAKEREEDGAIFSKRMVHDEHIRQVRKNAGFKGGNPLLLNQKSTTGVKQKSTPSSSSSSSTSSSEERIGALLSFGSEMTESERLSSEGKFLDALSVRIDLDTESITRITKDMFLPISCFENYLQNRAAEKWRTKQGNAIDRENWIGDLKRFASNWALYDKSENAPQQAPRPIKRLPANWREIAQEIYGHPVTCSEDDLTADQRADIYRQARA
jgi:hypothetical protein